MGLDLHLLKLDVDHKRCLNSLRWSFLVVAHCVTRRQP
jgi:hypothetical protein